MMIVRLLYKGTVNLSIDLVVGVLEKRTVL